MQIPVDMVALRLRLIIRLGLKLEVGGIFKWTRIYKGTIPGLRWMGGWVVIRNSRCRNRMVCRI